MEKFSAYRDPGTGIQPFLAPVPPNAPDVLATLLLPIRYALGIIRTAIVLTLALVYFALVQVLCLIFIPAPPIYRSITHILTFILARLALFVIGLFWIPVQIVSRKRGGRHTQITESWKPSKGDIIITNWSSWIELVWLAARFNPIFVLPVPESSPESTETSRTSAPITHKPGRHTGTGSANIQSSEKHSAAPRITIRGFQQVPLLRMVSLTGHAPPFFGRDLDVRSLEDIRRSSGRPVVVLPECTTSNGRGLLRFAKVFDQKIPIKNYQVFVMCVRYDPPTTLIPSLTHSIPTHGQTFLNPILHIFKISASLAPLPISIRLLAPSESPSSQLFVASDFVSGSADEDQLAEASANLVAQIGKFKRTGMGWEDKASLLHYRNQKKK